jgi:SAM-dependent methyltransferase
MGTIHEKIFGKPSVVAFYASKSDLQAPEKRFLEEHATELANARLLDIGIGGGRTTVHVPDKVKSYTGVDISAAMIDATRARFGGDQCKLDLRVADTRDLSAWEREAFDAILFSYNGLDYVSRDDRMVALAEIRRVLKKGGLFCLSSHSTLAIDHAYGLRRPVRSLYVRLTNGPASLHVGKPWVIFDDGTYGRGAPTYYVHPEEMERDLVRLGFEKPRVFSLDAAKELSGTWDESVWLTYVTRAA